MEIAWSTITLITELILTVGVLVVFYYGYRFNRFLTHLAIPALVYETLVNITYMVHQALERKEAIEAGAKHSAVYVGLAIAHGSISLVMFVTLVVFLLIAWRKYKAGINYFKEHKIVTGVFLFWWLVSVASGVTFYYVIYFTNL